LGAIILVVIAFAVDRVALLVWRLRVSAVGDALQAAAEELGKPAKDLERRPLIIWSGTRDKWQVPLLDVAIRGPVPEAVSVDGNGGLTLLYLPPLLAWTRHVPWAYRRPVIQSPDIYPYNDIYLIRISTLESKPQGKELRLPRVQLEHGYPF
jgi:hypothetical protein